MKFVMTSVDQVKHLTDDELFERLSNLLRQSRRVESALIAHIAEVDERRLYLRESGSMFTYCTRVLHLSEHEAYARITVARASRRFPALLAMLCDGRLHLSGIGKLVPHLTDANHERLLARATHKTKSEIEELVAEIAPKPDAAPTVRRLPMPAEAGSASELGPDRAREPSSLASAPPPELLGPDRVACDPPIAPRLADPMPSNRAQAAVTPLAPARYKIQFTAGPELRDKLERLQALTRQDLAAVIEAAVTEKLERLESRRFGLTKSPRKSLDRTDTTATSRYLPAPVRRTVRQRDGDQCTFVGQEGTRCTERRRLEFHHREPYARGGSHSPDNVCLMCRQRNARLAERDYGRRHMEKYRRTPDRISEAATEYVACSPPVTFTPHESSSTFHA